MSSPSSSGSKKEVIPPRKNDSDCYNCAGVTVLTEEMQKRGQKPRCIGLEYKAGKSIPPETMAELEKLPVLPPNTRMYIVGLSQASVRMHRMGQIPLIKFGVVINTSFEAISASENNEKKLSPPSEKKAPAITEKKPVPSAAKAANTADAHKTDASREPADPSKVAVVDRLNSAFSSRNLTAFANAYWRSCGRLATSMGRVFDRSFDRLPSRFYKSSSRMISACDNFAHKVSDRVQKIISPREDKK